MADTIIKEIFRLPEADFLGHLEIVDNDRIIFSGRFGTGKTTFLKHFFSEIPRSAISNTYNVFHIFPVNYSVAANEDIFRYIQYDILLEMLRKGYTVEDFDFSFFETLPFFTQQHFVEVGVAMLKMIPIVGKEISVFSDAMEKLIKKFKGFSRTANTSPADELVKIIDTEEKNIGSIFEQDVVTQLIRQQLILKKNGKNQEDRQNILIIDDLDRIDPEHIFRILNIFAAHFDQQTSMTIGNKFGFDKVIVVCDIQNIRQIFQARFGLRVDFNGYIDKFYSSHIFEYFPFGEFLYTAEKIIEEVMVYDDNRNRRSIRKYTGSFLRIFLEWLVINQQLDLRSIFKLRNSTFKSGLILVGDKRVDGIYAEIVWCLKLLVHMKGHYLSLIESFSHEHKWPREQLNENLDKLSASLMYIQWMAASAGGNASVDSYMHSINGERYLIQRKDEVPNFTIIQGEDIHNNPGFDSHKLLRALIIQTIEMLRREGIL